MTNIYHVPDDDVGTMLPWDPMELQSLGINFNCATNPIDPPASPSRLLSTPPEIVPVRSGIRLQILSVVAAPLSP